MLKFMRSMVRKLHYRASRGRPSVGRLWRGDAMAWLRRHTYASKFCLASDKIPARRRHPFCRPHSCETHWCHCCMP